MKEQLGKIVQISKSKFSVFQKTLAAYTLIIILKSNEKLLSIKEGPNETRNFSPILPCFPMAQIQI